MFTVWIWVCSALPALKLLIKVKISFHTVWQPTFLQDGLGDHKGELLQRLHVLVPSTEDADLWQADNKGPRHGGLVVVPAPDGAGNVTADDGARRGEAVIRQEHTARLQLQLEKGEKNKREVAQNETKQRSAGRWCDRGHRTAWDYTEPTKTTQTYTMLHKVHACNHVQTYIQHYYVIR